MADVANAARDIAGALASLGHAVETLAIPPGPAHASVARVVGALAARPPDVVFNLCESLAGDTRHEPVLPALLDLAGLRYTGSPAAALALALAKDLTKRVLVGAGVPTPEAVAIAPGRDPAPAAALLPAIVKPAREDASNGISHRSVVQSRAQLAAQVAEIHARFGQPALVERFIDGREVYVSLVGHPPVALPMHEIDFALPAGRPRIVTYAGKWDKRSADYRGTTPTRAVLDERVRARCESAARAAFEALGLRDYARIDLRIDAAGNPFVIDVNPNCDLSRGAGVARAASYGGLSYADLIARVCEAALARAHESEPHVDRAASRSAAPSRPSRSAADPAAPPGGSRRARGARRDGRSVHGGGGVGRARADRRRRPRS